MKNNKQIESLQVYILAYLPAQFVPSGKVYLKRLLPQVG